jgi:hypothetical protein
MSNIPITSNPLTPSLGAPDIFVVVQMGVTKQVQLELISALLNFEEPNVPVVIMSGSTSISPYIVQPAITNVIVNKTVGASTFIQLNDAITYNGRPILVKDYKGDAATNNITIEFSGGELADGESTLVIDTDYGLIRLNPFPAGGAWFISD